MKRPIPVHEPATPLPRWLAWYDVAWFLASPFWLSYYLLARRARRPGIPGIKERLGVYSPALKEALQKGTRPAWLHAVSVGEFLSAQPLLSALRTRFPRRRWVVSTTTPTGQRLARERLASQATILYAPWDMGPCVRRSLAAVRPRLFVGMETELWPQLFLRLGAEGVPIAVVNGRISPASFPRYRAVRHWMKAALAEVRVWAVQTPADKERLLALGADPGRIHVTGNLKVDAGLYAEEGADAAALGRSLGWAGAGPLWVAGSTHPGEETQVLAAFRQVRMDYPSVRLLLAPRHPERLAEVERVVRKAGFTPRRRSQMGDAAWTQGAAWTEDVIVIVDTLGELARLYAAADIVFVGGSLVPRGGHNLLEPARLAKPVITGPFTYNFQSVAEWLEEAGGLRVVRTSEELATQLRQWLAQPDRGREVGERACRALAAQGGAVKRTVELLCEHLGPSLSEDGDA